MEKVLRKVKCSERLPDKEGEYHCITDSGDFTSGTFYKQTWLTPYRIMNIDYWYEEIDISTLMAQSVADLFTEEDKQNYRKATEVSLQKEAKERYEKAYDFMIDNEKYVLEGKATTLQDFKTALKIAAGLEE